MNEGTRIDCHMRNPKKQFLTMISSGVVKDIIHMVVVLVLVIFIFNEVYCLMMLLILILIFFFCWRSLANEGRVDIRQKDNGGF